MMSSKYIEVDPKEKAVGSIYKLLIGGILPRPIAVVSSWSKKGDENLAPFSFFNGVCSNPPCIMISIARRPNGQKKDTLINIEETGEFVVNSASSWMLEKVVHTGASYPYGVNELEMAGLTSIPSKKVRPARVRESAFQMECRLHSSLEIGDGSAGSSTIIVGEVILFHINEDIYQDGKINIDNYQPCARLGGATYSRVGETVIIPIPEVK